MTDELGESHTGNESDGADGVVRAQYDWESTSPSTAVIETLAIALNQEATTLDPLYESIDPDAFDALLQSNGSSANARDTSVTFTVADQQVTVHSRGDVVVQEGRQAE